MVHLFNYLTYIQTKNLFLIKPKKSYMNINTQTNLYSSIIYGYCITAFLLIIYHCIFIMQQFDDIKYKEPKQIAFMLCHREVKPMFGTNSILNKITQPFINVINK